jgi:hypothetical protein
MEKCCRKVSKHCKQKQQERQQNIHMVIQKRYHQQDEDDALTEPDHVANSDDKTEKEELLDVLIIGAGWAGLSAGKFCHDYMDIVHNLLMLTFIFQCLSIHAEKERN